MVEDTGADGVAEVTDETAYRPSDAGEEYVVELDSELDIGYEEFVDRVEDGLKRYAEAIDDDAEIRREEVVYSSDGEEGIALELTVTAEFSPMDPEADTFFDRETMTIPVEQRDTYGEVSIRYSNWESATRPISLLDLGESIADALEE